MRDSGSCSDIVSGKFINPNQLDGGVIWMKQILMNDLRCLPTDDVPLKIEGIGSVTTKAIVYLHIYVISRNVKFPEILK